MSRLAKTYRHGMGENAGKGLFETEPLMNTQAEPGKGIESGGAGLFSTVDDYARFAQMLANGGTLDGRRILGRKTMELMVTNHLTSLPAVSPPSHSYNRSKGLGLGVEVTMDLGRAGVPGSLGQFGWYG